MRVENISNLQNINFNKFADLHDETKVDGQVSNAAVTSIYNQNGITLPFGIWAKGANPSEEACIKLFRKVREGRCRKYTEPQIIGFMNELRGARPENNIEEVVKEFFMTYKICHEEFGAELEKAVPDAQLVRNYLNVVKNCDEYERLGLLGFTQHELCCGATKPLEALSNAKPESQKRFVKIMNDISFEAGDSDKSDVLYEDLRHVIYASEDLPHLDAKGKLQYFSDILFDYKHLKTEKSTPRRVVNIAKDIVAAMVDVLQI